MSEPVQVGVILEQILYELRCLNLRQDRLLNNSESARLLGVSRQTIINHIKTGKLHQTTVDGKKGILQSEINKLIYGNV